MNKETVQKNVYILHLNYRTVYCPKKALNSEMGNTVILNITRLKIDTTAFSLSQSYIGMKWMVFHRGHRRTWRRVDPDTPQEDAPSE